MNERNRPSVIQLVELRRRMPLLAMPVLLLLADHAWVPAIVAALGHPERSWPSIHIGGTNGKGSTCAMLESILLRAGYRVGLYIKPHFLDFNERARVNGDLASDEMLVQAFDAVEAVRGDTPLTYFEFTTLAILGCMAEAKLDLAVLLEDAGQAIRSVDLSDLVRSVN